MKRGTCARDDRAQRKFARREQPRSPRPCLCRSSHSNSVEGRALFSKPGRTPIRQAHGPLPKGNEEGSRQPCVRQGTVEDSLSLSQQKKTATDGWAKAVPHSFQPLMLRLRGSRIKEPRDKTRRGDNQPRSNVGATAQGDSCKTRALDGCRRLTVVGEIPRRLQHGAGVPEYRFKLRPPSPWQLMPDTARVTPKGVLFCPNPEP